MELPHPPDAIFALITDPDGVAPCVPGAILHPDEGDPDGRRTGEIVLGFGPIRYRYKGTIRITAADAKARTVSYQAAGAETSGEGDLGLEMSMKVGDGAAGGSTLDVSAEISLAGMVADYGLGMAEDVARDVINQFVSAVSARDLGPRVETPAATPTSPKPIGGFRLLFRVFFRRLRRRFRSDPATRST
jgi:carbon monoxide dehydrogenase subunit G